MQHSEIQRYGIRFEYPEIANAKSFNAAVHQIVDPLVRTFGSEPSQPGNAIEQAYLTGHYTASILKNGVVSVLLEWTQYFPMAAHPSGLMASVNYDSRSRRVLILSDIFRPGVNYLARLSEMAIASLSQQEFAVVEAVREGAGPVESNFRVFTLTDDTLVLHFQTYQVAAGAAGPQEVVIPLNSLTSLLRRR